MSKQHRNKQATGIAKPYEPTADDRAALEALRARRKTTPRLKAEKTQGPLYLSLDHPDTSCAEALLMNALGTTDSDFMTGILNQLRRAASLGQQVDELLLNFLLSVIKGIQPQDQVEAMLAAQMAAVHGLTMTYARDLANVKNIPQQDSAERTFNKLARTFAAQVEALKRYRSTGEQKVTVEHVTVNEGGRAIVGNVLHGGAGGSKNQETTA